LRTTVQHPTVFKIALSWRIMLTVITVCHYQAAFFLFIPTHSAQSHRIPCAFPRIPCSPSAFPTHSAHSRAVPRIPAQSRAFPRSPAHSRAVPRSPAQSDKLVIMCTNFQRVASPSLILVVRCEPNRRNMVRLPSGRKKNRAWSRPNTSMSVPPLASYEWAKNTRGIGKPQKHKRDQIRFVPI